MVSRRFLTGVIIGLLAATLFVTEIPLYPNSMHNIAYSAFAGYSEIQTLSFHFGAFVTLEFHTYCDGAYDCTGPDGGIIFSMQSPDGSSIVRNAIVTRTFSHSFMAWKPGIYTLNFGNPRPNGFFQAALNITVYQPPLGQYFFGQTSFSTKLPCANACQ